MTALVALCGGVLAGGLVLLVAAVRGLPPKPQGVPAVRRVPRQVGLRAALAASGALVVGVPTRWPVGALLAAVLGWSAPSLFGGKAAGRRAIERMEAIASWTEMLRDTMAAAAGLQQAIIATRTVAPQPIRAEVDTLAARLDGREPLSGALREFADSLADPGADLVVAALVLAADQRAQRLNEVLSALAASTREYVGMRLRVETSRARVRTAASLVTVFTIGLATVLALFARAYLEPFDDPLGQVVLLLVGLFFGAAFWWLAEISRVVRPERFLTGYHVDQSGRRPARPSGAAP